MRNATVISYSPSKKSSSKMAAADLFQQQVEEQQPKQRSSSSPVTPVKASSSSSDAWSSVGTPARTPRRDIDAGLLRGAVVFVDVHTQEGADASAVFVDLLSQMGARCVKSWPWNPSSPTNNNKGESSSSAAAAAKIGITHVVYKDGGKRTLQKVRESNGVVQCVGVSWVLDCERENEWLEEAPYYIDTSLVPRGGKNRRKSMEPKALANMNGTLVTPVKPNAGNNTTTPRECQTVPNNHMSRRDSSLWMRTPSDHGDDDQENRERDDFMQMETDWENADLMMTPVPKTPAPEAVARFAMDVTPETPSNPFQSSGFSDDSSSSSPSKEDLLMRTCPPKQTNKMADLGRGILSPEKDQNVMMRLMAARRKSMQFAPKVGSPLSRAWQ